MTTTPPSGKRGRRKKAFVCLRVSDPKQVKREYDPEGLSLPDQRIVTRRRADELDADVEEEFLEAGYSGRSVDKRPEFQRMLRLIKERGDIDYVIFDSLSRANRNRFDDAIMVMMLRKAGVTVVSATENIDETPAGQLLHGIMAAVNEFRSASDGQTISRKMAYKASIGGTPGRAKIGYLNIKEKYEDREVATIAIDEERAPLVKLAFDMFATGTYTVDSLQEILVDAGLKALPHGKQPAKPISRSQVARMLRDRYYIGYVTLKGVEYQGRHEPLIPWELFHRVQEILDTHSGAGIRQRKHRHYLKGTLWCHRCGHRLIIAVAKGTYEYFLCRGRQQHVCDLPYLPVDQLEKAVITHYRTITFPAAFQHTVRAQFDKELAANADSNTQLRTELDRKLAALSTKEDHYLDLVGDPDWPNDKLKARMAHIRDEKEKIHTQLKALDADLQTGRDVLNSALKLLDRPQRLYRTCTPAQRKMLNNIIFTKLTVDVTGITGEELAEPFNTLIPAGRHYTQHRRLPAPRQATNSPDATPGTGADDPDDDTTPPTLTSCGHSSSKTTWVPPAGFEPALPPPEGGALSPELRGRAGNSSVPDPGYCPGALWMARTAMSSRGVAEVQVWTASSRREAICSTGRVLQEARVERRRSVPKRASSGPRASVMPSV
jgi:site-specific DNA recombinase